MLCAVQLPPPLPTEGPGGDTHCSLVAPRERSSAAAANSRIARVEAFLPAPARPLVLELLQALPTQLCSQLPGDVVAAPSSFKDNVCPLGLAAAPVRAAASGLRPWGLVIAAAAFGADLRWGAPAAVQPSYSAQYDGENTTIAFPGFPELNAASGDPPRCWRSGCARSRSSGRRMRASWCGTGCSRCVV
jgi:hypothetical protein